MTDLVKFRGGEIVTLKTYTNEDVVLRGQRIEALRMSSSVDDCARIVGVYLLEANKLLNEKRRMPLNQIAPVCKQILDGRGWNLAFEELSNIIQKGVSGGYGNFYYFDMATIGLWISKYIDSEREAVFSDKEYYRDQRRQLELDSMGENHIKLLRKVLKKDK